MNFKVGDFHEAFGTITKVEQVVPEQLDATYSTKQKVIYEYDVNSYTRIDIIDLDY